jgi:ubiquinone/menaquinone biosynthesis C-methylase UbiE
MNRVPEFPWPRPPGARGAPAWTGQGFRVDDQQVPVLAYEAGRSGWTDELTDFHEDTAGASHPIDLASRRHALEMVRAFLPGPSAIVLEVGCSSGFMLRDLRLGLPDALIIGSDYVRGPLERLAASVPDIPLLQMDVVKCPLPDASVDVVVALNVLEHIEDQAAALAQIHRVLKPGGAAVLEVPAGPNLYDVYDKTLLHFRRYSMRDLVWLVEGAGFRVARKSHLGFFVYPAFFITKKRNRRHLALSEAEQKRIVAENIKHTQGSRLFGAVVAFETFLGRWVSYPFGIRCLVTCLRQG